MLFEAGVSALEARMLYLGAPYLAPGDVASSSFTGAVGDLDAVVPRLTSCEAAVGNESVVVSWLWLCFSKFCIG